MEQLFLVRHAETDWNAERRLQGHADRALSVRGCEQASALRTYLQDISFNAVFASDLRRTRETASLAGFDRFNETAVWREFDVGNWSGRLIGDIVTQDGDAYSRWRAGELTPPGGESWAAFEKRIRAGLSVFDSLPGRVLLVTHSGVIRAILKILFGIAPGSLGAVGHASVTVVETKDPHKLASYDFRPRMQIEPVAD